LSGTAPMTTAGQAGHTATFLVLTAPGAPGPTVAQAVATFGEPARAYRYKSYAISSGHEG
jgi:hypothetical protein